MLTIVIVSFNARDDLAAALDSLVAFLLTGK